MITVCSVASLRHNRVAIKQISDWLLGMLIKGRCVIILVSVLCYIYFCSFFFKPNPLLTKSAGRREKNRDSGGGGTPSILHSSRPSGTLRCSNSKAKQFSVSCTCPEDKQPLSPPLPPFLSSNFFCFSFSRPLIHFPFLLLLLLSVPSILYELFCYSFPFLSFLSFFKVSYALSSPPPLSSHFVCYSFLPFVFLSFHIILTPPFRSSPFSTFLPFLPFSSILSHPPFLSSNFVSFSVYFQSLHILPFTSFLPLLSFDSI